MKSSEAARIIPPPTERRSSASTATLTARGTEKLFKIHATRSKAALIEEGLAGSATTTAPPP
jgi:hypothetical protein